jgi:rhomboid protease GluP
MDSQTPMPENKPPAGKRHSSEDPASAITSAAATTETVAVRRAPSARRAHEYGLVALSQGIPYSIEPTAEGEFQVVVDAHAAERAARQMDYYDHESRYWPPAPLRVPDHAHGGWAIAGWVALLLGGYAWQIDKIGWREAALSDSTRIFGEGEFWRAWTALLLHADGAHLGANLVFGAFFLYWAARSFGPGTAWLAVWLGGAAGNLLNALFYYPEIHRSLGASTAVFAAIGLLAAYPLGCSVRLRKPLFRHTGWIPLVGGALLLGWFGSGQGDVRTDVTAHLAGFLAALPLGFFLAWYGGGQQRPPAREAAWALLGTLPLIWALWQAARFMGGGD